MTDEELKAEWLKNNRPKKLPDGPKERIDYAKIKYDYIARNGIVRNNGFTKSNMQTRIYSHQSIANKQAADSKGDPRWTDQE